LERQRAPKGAFFYLYTFVMAGLDPAIQTFGGSENWITGSSPVMTKEADRRACHSTVTLFARLRG
jgi:hypothetical protein